MQRDATKPLKGRIELDDAYLGGERSGGKRGRGAPGKTALCGRLWGVNWPDGNPRSLS
jgi:hypothetical protein